MINPEVVTDAFRADWSARQDTALDLARAAVLSCGIPQDALEVKFRVNAWDNVVPDLTVEVRLRTDVPGFSNRAVTVVELLAEVRYNQGAEDPTSANWYAIEVRINGGGCNSHDPTHQERSAALLSIMVRLAAMIRQAIGREYSFDEVIDADREKAREAAKTVGVFVASATPRQAECLIGLHDNGWDDLKAKDRAVLRRLTGSYEIFFEAEGTCLSVVGAQAAEALAAQPSNPA